MRASSRISERDSKVNEIKKQEKQEAVAKNKIHVNRFLYSLNNNNNLDDIVDFNLPDIWSDEKSHQYQSFRLLKQNYYRQPLKRTLCSSEDIPICSCFKSNTGYCDENCSNRLLYM